MHKSLYLLVLAGMPSLSLNGQVKPADERAWISRSNAYTQQLLEVSNRHSPEGASAEGLAAYDREISVLTQVDEDRERLETEAVLGRLKNSLGTEKDPRVLQDLQILIHQTEYQLRRQTYDRAHKVPFLNASELVFSGLQGLLDD